MDATILIAIVPVVLAVALIITIIRRNITERGAGQTVDIAGAIPAVIVLMVAVLLIGSMAGISSESYEYDGESGELVIKGNVASQDVQPWDSYASSVRSLVIEDGVQSVGSGAFDSLTALEYLNMPESLTSIGANAFGASLKDFRGEPTTTAGEYAGTGDGSLYLCDPSIYAYSYDSLTIQGLVSDASDAAYLVIPTRHNGIGVTTIYANAFKDNTVVKAVVPLPDCKVVTIGSNAFQGCTSLADAVLPSGLTTLGIYAFHGCTALEEISIPDGVTTLSGLAFYGCTALAEVDLPDTMTAIQNNVFNGCAFTAIQLPSGLKTLGNNVFEGCTSLASISFPAGFESMGTFTFRGCTSLASISFPSTVTSIGATAFYQCTGITSMTFASGFSATLASDWCPCTFYASDGTTVIDKTVASSLAGHTFTGTASALVMQS